MEKKHIVVAIDGYSSCGKSTLARALARKLNFLYIDSGAMYRAATLYFLDHKINMDDPEAVEKALDQMVIRLETRDDALHTFLNGKDVSEVIREMRVSEKVSDISSLRLVRQALVQQQRAIADDRNVVIDGRDIGTAVFPDAQVKIFMTADPRIRADRRYQEIHKKYPGITLEEVFKNLAQRDYQDTTRKESPLVHAENAITLDNSLMDQAEQLDFALKLLEPHIKGSARQGTSEAGG